MLTNSELVTFCGQTALFLRAGISFQEALSAMAEDAATPEAKKLLSQLLAGLEAQQELPLVLEQSGEFPHYCLEMIRIGYYAGKLDDVFSSLAVYYEREEGISRSVRSAVTYPAIMIVMLFLMIAVLIGKVFPIFAEVFGQLGSGVSGPARLMVSLSGTAGYVLLAAFLVVLVSGIIIFYLAKTNPQFRSRFFLTRKLSLQIASGRFANAMALCISSGLDTEESLDMAASLSDHPLFTAKIAACKAALGEGISFADALTQAGIFNHTENQFIKIGTKTGNMEQVMEQIARQCEEKTQFAINHLLSILEPSLVAALAVIVGAILLSVMLPLLQIMTTMGA